MFKCIYIILFVQLSLAGCVATGSNFSLQESVQEDKASIVFYRPNEFLGSAVSLVVTENENEILKIQNGQFITYFVEPGVNVYSIKTIGKNNELRLNLEPNKIYYVRSGIRTGTLVNTLYLSRVYEEEALEELKACCKSGKR